jgi:hypothetical protein
MGTPPRDGGGDFTLLLLVPATGSGAAAVAASYTG